MNILTKFRSQLRRFARDDNGSYTIETVLILPILIWGMLATYTFVDSYRMQALNLRATYTISDLLTRQWDPVDDEFMDGLTKFHEFLTNDGHDTILRVTVVYWDEPTDKHRMVWSYTSDESKPRVRAAEFKALKPVIPVLANADTAIIVETWMDYEPPFDVGLSASQFNTRVIASPRFVPQLLWADDVTS